MTVNILGTDYAVETLSKAEDSYLNNCEGYCDHTSKRIVVREKDEDDDVDDYEYFKKKIMRHEITHAFMHESGLGNNWTHQNIGQEETTVDWIAIQFPKMLKAFQDTGCI